MDRDELALVITVGTPLVSGARDGPAEASPGDRAGVTGGPSERRDRSTGRAAPDQRRHKRATTTDLLVRVPRSMSVRARPDSDAAVVGTMPSGSKYYGVPITAWVEETANHGRWGRVEMGVSLAPSRGVDTRFATSRARRPMCRSTSICPITGSP